VLARELYALDTIKQGLGGLIPVVWFFASVSLEHAVKEIEDVDEGCEVFFLRPASAHVVWTDESE